MSESQAAASPAGIRHPVGDLTRATLSFESGASRARIAGEPGLQDLFRLSTGEPRPEVDVFGSRVNVRYRLTLLERLNYALVQGWPRTDVALNTKVAWDL